MTREAVTADGAALELRVWPGDPARAPLVLMHEGLGSVSLWRDFPEALALATGHPVVAFSRRGHGWSDPLAAPHTVEFMHHEARVVLPAILSVLSIERPILVGHSDGGSIALIHAGMRGNDVLGVVAIAAHVFVEPISTASIRDARQRFATSDLRDKLARHHRDPAHTFFAWNDIWLHPDFVRWNIEDVLPAIRVPVLVIQGRGDAYGTPRQCEAIAAGCGADVLLLADCGHSPHRDRRATTLDAVASFVRTVGRTE